MTAQFQIIGITQGDDPISENSLIAARIRSSYGIATNSDNEAFLAIRFKQPRSIGNTPGLRTCDACGMRNSNLGHRKICAGVYRGDHTMPRYGRTYELGQDYVLSVMPDLDGRQVGLVTGGSGAGKSHWSREYAMEYLTMYPGNEVWILSGVGVRDPAFSNFRENSRVSFIDILAPDISEKMNSLSLDDCANKLLIFDDICAITNKEARASVEALMLKVLTGGRHTQTSILITEHVETRCNDKINKYTIQEATFYVVFPRMGNPSSMTRLLSIYGGCNKLDVREMLNTPTRWLYFRKTPIKYYISELGAKLISA